MVLFSDFLASIIKFEKISPLGDFNVPVNDISCTFALNFFKVIDSFNFTDEKGPTHIKGNTTDLVFTYGLNLSITGSE